MTITDELRNLYERQPSARDNNDALIERSIADGNARRRRRGRQRMAGGLLVAAVVSVAGIAIARRNGDPRTYVATVTTTTRESHGLPVATTREFPDLERMLNQLLPIARNEASDPAHLAATVVHTTPAALGLPTYTSAQGRSLRVYEEVYEIQFVGSRFICCAPHTQGTARRFVWQPATHGPVSSSLGPPIDLARYGHVYAVRIPSGCVRYPEASREYLSPTGQLSSIAHAGWAIIVHFTDGGQQLALPTGFNPARASDLTLSVFGIPPRPRDAAGRASWTREWGHVQTTTIAEWRCPAFGGTAIPAGKGRP